ncbi:hypothetical protein MHD_07585 [Mannheimia granulomatis]|uniref:Lipoprotein n=1 Tax=Mannheimia granulomatis TaxID=85402 RepID=A0A011NE05_9PAST|nr:hypothetical protein [Mannheimia granulomatis]EXI62655.1 hypothetical protein AK33_04800 [Mannheimia granulomatis]RGE47817.1 hypothetical protein MHD_07585 [Mannheimia granulomatis]
MKKITKIFAFTALIATLSACTGVRGHDGSGNVCKNSTWMGISIIELVSPCKK